MPKISVIIPNYNHARYLEQRIESILNQTFQDFEIIFLDDSSTDNSREVFAKYTHHPKINQIIFNEINSGSGYKQWSKGFSLATGEYIWIAESDDYAEPTILEKLVQKLDHNPSVGLAYTQSWNINDEGERIHLCKEWTDALDEVRWSGDFVNVGRDECKYLLDRNTIPNASAVLMRRSVLIEAGKFDTQFRLAADYLLWAKMLMISDIAYIAEPLNYFRSHANTVRNTTRAALELEERLIVICYLLKGIQAPEPFWEQVFHPVVGWWMRLMASEKLPLSVNLRIYSILRDVDSNINYRILRNSIEVLMRKVRSHPQV